MMAAAKLTPKRSSVEPAPQIHSLPSDQARVKRTMEATAELAVGLVKEMIEEHVANNTRPSKDDIAIMEHTHSNAMRVFNLSAGAKNMTPLEEPRSEPRGFAGLKVFSGKKPKPAELSSGSGAQGGGSSE